MIERIAREFLPVFEIDPLNEQFQTKGSVNSTGRRSRGAASRAVRGYRRSRTSPRHTEIIKLFKIRNPEAATSLHRVGLPQKVNQLRLSGRRPSGDDENREVIHGSLLANLRILYRTAGVIAPPFSRGFHDLKQRPCRSDRLVHLQPQVLRRRAHKEIIRAQTYILESSRGRPRTSTERRSADPSAFLVHVPVIPAN